MSTIFGNGNYKFQLVEDWPDWPINGVASDVATDSSGNVFVAVRTLQTPEQNSGTMLVFDDKGNFLDRFGDEYFATPHGLWINSEDEIWFADSGNHAVRKFDTSGKLMMTLGTPNELGNYGSPFRSPTRAVQSDDGDIFVSDGYKVIIIPSMRTPKETIDLAVREMGLCGYVVNKVDKQAYLSAYALANYVIVTCDSTSMISEAATSGKPIFVAHMKAKKNNYRFKKFFELFKQMGITRDLGEQIETWTYNKHNEAQRIAIDIKNKIKN